MLTLKYRDHRGSESITPGVFSTSWHEGVLTAHLDGGGTIQYGPNMGGLSPASVPIAYVMNEAGATVARYDMYPMSASEREKFIADAEVALEAANGNSQSAKEAA